MPQERFVVAGLERRSSTATRGMQCCVSLGSDGRKVVSSVDEMIYVYPHVLKSGGTALSMLLGLSPASRTVCGSRISSKFNASDAMCQSGAEYGEKQEQWETYTRYLRSNNREGISPKFWVAFGHFSYSISLSLENAINIFPLDASRRVKLLIMLREPLNHRLSLFNARFAGSRLYATFSEWIHSREYEEEAQLSQLRAYRTLGERPEDLLAHPSLAWIGITERWLQSLCSLSLMLQREHGVAIDRIPLWALKARAQQRLKLSDFALTPDDIAHFTSLESREILFVQYFERYLDSYIDVVPNCLIPLNANTSLRQDFFAAKLLDQNTAAKPRRSIRTPHVKHEPQAYHSEEPFSLRRPNTQKRRRKKMPLDDAPMNSTGRRGHRHPYPTEEERPQRRPPPRKQRIIRRETKSNPYDTEASAADAPEIINIPSSADPRKSFPSLLPITTTTDSASSAGTATPRGWRTRR